MFDYVVDFDTLKSILRDHTIQDRKSSRRNTNIAKFMNQYVRSLHRLSRQNYQSHIEQKYLDKLIRAESAEERAIITDQIHNILFWTSPADFDEFNRQAI